MDALVKILIKYSLGKTTYLDQFNFLTFAVPLYFTSSLEKVLVGLFPKKTCVISHANNK
jgi:hypothetical protein